jgi:Zn-dependent protease with chaperone function
LTAVVLFALYAAAAGMLAPVLLRGSWATRSPRPAMTPWLVLPVSFLCAVVLAVLAATAPFPLTWPAAPPAGGRLLLTGPPVRGGRAIALAGLLLAVAVVLRAAGCVAGELRRGWRDRRDHAALVAAIGRPGDEPGVAIVDHDAPAVYCLPGGRHQVVISDGALAALTQEQLRAVLAHERAHLRHRHHLILALAAALARAFPRVPLLSQARLQLVVLAEMAADDEAARRHRRDDLAAALVVLARASAGRSRPCSRQTDPKQSPASSGCSIQSHVAPGLPGWQPSPGLSRLWSSRPYHCSLRHATPPVTCSQPGRLADRARELRPARTRASFSWCWGPHD